MSSQPHAQRQRLTAQTLERMRDGIRKWEAQGSRLGKTYFLGLVGQGEALMGEPETADRTLDDALAELVERTPRDHYHVNTMPRDATACTLS